MSCTRTTKTQIHHAALSMKVARACHFHFLKEEANVSGLLIFSPNFKFSSLNKHYGDLLTHSTSLLLGSSRTKNGITKRVDKQMMQVIHTPNQIIIYIYIC